MNLSLRTKILAAYGVLLTLFIVILFTGFSQMKGMASRLDLIQLGYLPLTKTVTSFRTFSHLDDSFDISKIVSNRSNRLFLESITITNPRLMEQGFRKGLQDARVALLTSSSHQQERALDRIGISINKLLEEHRTYNKIIQNALADIKANHVSVALARNEHLLGKKRAVRLQLDLLERKLDDLVRRGIQGTVREERRTVFLILGLSILTFVLAIGIGIIAIRGLSPLRKLTEVTREIAAGDLEQRAPIQSRDEVGELASEFNRMADSIQERDLAIRTQQDALLQSEKMAVIGRMASKISHEVKNPLNALSLNVELLEEEIKSDDARKTLKMMSTEIDRLNQVSENYLSLARSRKSPAEETDLSKILSHVETLVQPECEKQGIEIEIDTRSDLPSLHVNGTRLEQAILNLTRNAIEAMKSGGRLGVRVRREDNQLVLEIWDTGPGMSEEIRLRIFEPFYTTKEKGTGLGLAITHEIVREQGGTIACQSETGKGSSFLVSLPIGSHDV